MQPEVELSPAVAALFAAPRHAGRPAAGACRHGRGGSVGSGCLIELWLNTEDARVTQARFEAFGCPSAVACADWLCHWLAGRELAQAQRLTGLELVAALELTPAKRAVALTVEDALKAALTAPLREVDG